MNCWKMPIISPQKGIAEKRASCMRRAVSTAYYAVFHLLVEDFVENWPFADQRARLARMFDHKMRDAPFTPISERNPTLTEAALVDVKTAFRQVQADRHRNETRNETRETRNETRETRNETRDETRGERGANSGRTRDSCNDFSTPGGMKMGLRRGKKVDSVNGSVETEGQFDLGARLSR